MGSLAKKMLKQRARVAKKKAVTDLRSVGRTPLFTLAKADGTPLLRTVKRGGEDVTVTWCFTEHAKADTFCLSLAVEYDLPLTVTRLPAVDFLGSMMNHLAQADIDFLLFDGEIEFPLTTIAVRMADDEKWTGLLNKTREVPGANLLLVQVAMDVLQKANPPSAVAVETATYADLVQVLMGKKGRLPAPDLGIIWMLASSVAEGVEPVYLKLGSDSPDNVSGESLVIGPMFFDNYQHAMNWPKVLPPQVIAHLAEMTLNLVPYRAMGLLEEVNDNFPTATIDDRKPDVFLLNGGCLPMSLAGAKYTDELAYGDEKPPKTFATIAEEDGDVELRKASVLLLAAALDIEIVHDHTEEN